MDKQGPGRPPTPRLVPLANICLLPKSRRPRSTESQDQIFDYTRDMENGDVFPPITVFKGPAGEAAGRLLTPSGEIADIDTEDVVLVLSDGYHRVLATLALQKDTEIKAIIKSGDWRDAEWAALGANHLHGLPLSNADKHRVVTLILSDKEWSKRSARMIAAHCHVSPGFVDERKKALKAMTTADGRQSDTVVTDRRGRKMQTKNIGKKKAGDIGTAIKMAVDQHVDEHTKKTGDRSIHLSAPAPSDRALGNTSDIYLDELQLVIGNAKRNLGEAGWKRFVNEGREMFGKLTVQA